jgi:hypothetical protein
MLDQGLHCTPGGYPVDHYSDACQSCFAGHQDSYNKKE